MSARTTTRECILPSRCPLDGDGPLDIVCCFLSGYGSEFVTYTTESVRRPDAISLSCMRLLGLEAEGCLWLGWVKAKNSSFIMCATIRILTLRASSECGERSYRDDLHMEVALPVLAHITTLVACSSLFVIQASGCVQDLAGVCRHCMDVAESVSSHLIAPSV